MGIRVREDGKFLRPRPVKDREPRASQSITSEPGDFGGDSLMESTTTTMEDATITMEEA